MALTIMNLVALLRLLIKSADANHYLRPLSPPTLLSLARSTVYNPSLTEFSVRCYIILRLPEFRLARGPKSGKKILYFEPWNEKSH